MIIAMSCTPNWYHYLCVSIYSLLKTNDVQKIYLFTETDTIEELSWLQSKFPSVISIINYQNFINNYPIKEENRSYTNAALIRLLLSQYLPEEKVLYLDTDAIVVKNIESLWQTNLDSYYIAGIQDKGVLALIDYLDLKGINENYINSGVVLMNLKKIREDNLISKFFTLLNKETYRFPDQDVLNKVCFPKVLFLDNTYNCSTSCGISYNPKIIHYASKKTNWLEGIPQSEIWYDIEKNYESEKLK